jgi:hypothetical protein
VQKLWNELTGVAEIGVRGRESVAVLGPASPDSLDQGCGVLTTDREVGEAHGRVCVSTRGG